MKNKLHCSLIALALLAGVTQTSHAAVGFTVTPSLVSNTYSGDITLQITGLTNGETVVVQKFLDLNANGVIDSGDWLVQQFNLTDGQPGMVIGGVTNINVPGDLNPTNGAVTARLNFQNGGFVQSIVGNYLYELSSTTGSLAPLIQPFAVTNSSFTQTISGNVTSNSTSVTVPDAVLILFSVTAGQSDLGTALGGVVANDTGHYTILSPPGTYRLIAVNSNYVFNCSALPVISLAANQNATANLTLTHANNGLSGRVVDAVNTTFGLPGVLVYAEATNSVVSAVFTDANGDFNLPVSSDALRVGATQGGLTVHGYMEWDNGTNITAGVSRLILPFSKVTAMIYGSVKDSLGNPLPGVAVEASDNNGVYYVDGYTDRKGDFALGVVGGLTNDSWQVQIELDSSPTNYIYSGSALGSLDLSTRQSVLQNFTAVLATNLITGSLLDNIGRPIGGVEMQANGTVNGVYSHLWRDTDSNGNYALNVVNGTWSVGVDDGEGGYSLPGDYTNYFSPPPRTVVVSNNDAVLNFVATFVNNPKPRLGSLTRLSNGQFQFLLTGMAGQNYTLQVSTNLSSTNWTSLFTTNNAVTNSFIVIDPHATNQQRFYRVLVGP